MGGWHWICIKRDDSSSASDVQACVELCEIQATTTRALSLLFASADAEMWSSSQKQGRLEALGYASETQFQL